MMIILLLSLVVLGVTGLSWAVVFCFFFLVVLVFIAARVLSLVAASGATLHRGARTSHWSGFSCCGAQAVGTQAQ